MIVLEHSFPRHCPGESMPLRQNPCCEVTLTQVGHATGLPKNTGLGEDLRCCMYDMNTYAVIHPYRQG